MARHRFPEGEARSEMLYTLVRPRERDALDAVAAGQGRSRSHVIRQAVLQYTSQHQDGDHNQAVADDRA